MCSISHCKCLPTGAVASVLYSDLLSTYQQSPECSCVIQICSCMAYCNAGNAGSIAVVPNNISTTRFYIWVSCGLVCFHIKVAVAGAYLTCGTCSSISSNTSGTNLAEIYPLICSTVIVIDVKCVVSIVVPQVSSYWTSRRT